MRGAGSIQKIVAGTIVISTTATSALGIDFKIDLPPEHGKFPRTLDTTPSKLLPNSQEATVENRLPNQSTYDDNKVTSSSDQNLAPFQLDIPESDVALPRNENAQKNLNEQNNSNTKIGNSKNNNTSKNVANSARRNAAEDSVAFPSPQCLQKNVQFWEKVYSETDVNDAIVHDKEDLGRIFAVVRLPAGGRQRSLVVDEVRDHVAEKLRSLANQINSPDSWDKTQRELARFFPGEQLSRDVLLRSADNLRVQTGLRSRFEAGVQRSLKYLSSIHNVIQNHGLPGDIVYLPHVESSYHPQARSKVGAVGLWQIMPGTMRLTMGNKYVHRRTEPEVATVAAARILKQNFETTRSWPLALTAYNHGLAGVMRAVKNTGSRDLCEIIDKYESRSFRFASSNFYAQFLAARNVAQQRYIEISRREGPQRVLKQVLASTEKGNL